MGRKPGSKNKFSKSQDAEGALNPEDVSTDESQEDEMTEGESEEAVEESVEPDFSKAAKGFDKAVSKSEEVKTSVEDQPNQNIPGKYRKFNLKGEFNK